MIVISDRILRQAGLTLAEARALLAPADAELVVHIRQELDPISSPAIESLDGAHDPDSDQPSPCLDSDTARLNTAHDAPVEPPHRSATARSHRAAAADTADVVSDVDQDLAGQADVADRGYTLGAAVKLAAAHDCALTEAGGLYTLTSAFGTQPYTTLADAVACIKQFARWRDAVRQTIDTQTRRQRHERL